ncbi:hypothetical protein SPRG_05172 [Saprolegnia parasitica CBS 223.65]|uniref:Urease accessory protein UreF n=1 Tax=Saprolegnia parasitica (strain CBS 223.65) TaxID=695850 RepID=A0A067CHI6_SAPPC|nr:hypothetical protein SPRG_05172 [Saprolegnia parasitica CBS 223.65]KDO29983.1 hypothetical protein SPRG_05172 [Saprolegnia parasitica CBS 223.65]|eukprot:XP_012199166.1 hypothetical protein SPRG_05172 [Saprolegnia parasitica CBS 223.65]
MEWHTWQLVDSLYPTGGFAHSLGLESAVQEKIVTNTTNLRQFVVSALYQTGNLLLPFLCEAHADPSVENFARLDALVHAMTTNHVARRASIAQGTALLRVATQTYSHLPVLRAIKQTRPVGHHVVVLGTLCGALGLDSLASQRLLLFFTLRDILSAATRLNLVGPIESAKLQMQLAEVAETVLQTRKDRRVDDAYQSAPYLDLVQGRHDQLYTRIFNS